MPASKTYKLLFLLALCFFSSKAASSVTRDFHLSKAGLFYMRGYTFVIGLRTELSLQVVVYKCDSSLTAIDSTKVTVPKQKLEDFIASRIDSLHGKLQIELLTTDLKGVHLMRMTCDFAEQEYIKNIEPGRVNSNNRFSTKALTISDKRIDVTKVQEGDKISFFLKLFKLKSSIGNYEYEEVWQVPFSEKDVLGIALLYCNDKFVYVEHVQYVAGNYVVKVLKLNLSQGHLVSSYPISSEKLLYRSLHVAPAKNGDLFLVGQIHGASSMQLWHCAIDSFRLKDKITVQTFNLLAQKPTEKNNDLLVQVTNFDLYTKTVRCDIYKQNSAVTCKLNYCNLVFQLGTKATEQKLPALSTCIIDFYSGVDKSAKAAEALIERGTGTPFYFQLTFRERKDVIALPDKKQKHVYFCAKADVKKQNLAFFEVAENGKMCERKLLETIPFDQNPHWVQASESTVLIGRQSTKENFTVSLFI